MSDRKGANNISINRAKPYRGGAQGIRPRSTGERSRGVKRELWENIEGDTSVDIDYFLVSGCDIWYLETLVEGRWYICAAFRDKAEGERLMQWLEEWTPYKERRIRQGSPTLETFQ